MQNERKTREDNERLYPKRLTEIGRDVTGRRDNVVDDQTVCNKAPEWAEHQRSWEEDEPFDDGRSGRLDSK